MAKPVAEGRGTAQGPSKGKTGFNAVLFVLLILVAFGAANVISARFFSRIDMTEDKAYTLSQGAKDLV